jgi:hypothetical protein
VEKTPASPLAAQPRARRSGVSRRRSPLPQTNVAALRAAFRRLTALSFPRRFPIVQFPNLPLIVAFLAGEAGRVLSAGEHPYARSIAYLAMTIWAYEELVDGVNWFRRLLGLTYMVVMVVRVAHAVHG